MTNPAPTPIDYQVGMRLVDGNDVQYVVVAVTTRVVVTKKVVSGAVETAIPGFCNRKYRVAKVPAEVFEPMRNARGEIVEPVFGGSAPYSDESREADRASAGYRKLHGGEGW
jgi:hypothetical protein